MYYDYHSFIHSFIPNFPFPTHLMANGEYRRADNSTTKEATSRPLLPIIIQCLHHHHQMSSLPTLCFDSSVTDTVSDRNGDARASVRRCVIIQKKIRYADRKAYNKERLWIVRP